MDTYNWYKSRGICVNCHSEKAIKKQVHCLNCRDDKNLKTMVYWNKKKDSINKKRRELRQYRIENKLCTKCGCNLLDNYSNKMCKECLKNIRERYKIKNGDKMTKWELWRSEEKCIRCGSERYKDSKLCKRCYDVSTNNIKGGNSNKKFTKAY